MKSFVLIAAAVLLAGSATAQRHKIGSINAETEEGKFLQGIATRKTPPQGCPDGGLRRQVRQA